MRPSRAALAQIGRLVTPSKAALDATPPELKVRDFFREVRERDRGKEEGGRGDETAGGLGDRAIAALAAFSRPPPPPTSPLPPPPPPQPPQVCRFVPWTVKNYRLDELTTPAELRANVAALFKSRGARVHDPRVVDILIYKGREELESVALQHKQRHHLITDYVLGPRAARAAAAGAAGRAGRGESAFMQAFLEGTA